MSQEIVLDSRLETVKNLAWWLYLFHAAGFVFSWGLFSFIPLIINYVKRGQIRIGLQLDQELPPIQALMERYENVPMSLADACMVRLAEITSLPICTLDSDFAIYRAHGNARSAYADHPHPCAASAAADRSRLGRDHRPPRDGRCGDQGS